MEFYRESKTEKTFLFFVFFAPLGVGVCGCEPVAQPQELPPTEVGGYSRLTPTALGVYAMFSKTPLGV